MDFKTFVKQLNAPLNILQSNGVKAPKLWQYAVANAIGLSIDVSTDPIHNNTPAVTLFDLMYNSKGVYSSTLDACNEVMSFDLERVKMMIYTIWAKRQNMVKPRPMPIVVSENIPAHDAGLFSSRYIEKETYEVINKQEHIALISCVISIQSQMKIFDEEV